MLAILASGMSVASFAQPPDIDWLITYGADDVEYCVGAQQTADNGYIIAGYADTPPYHAFLIKTNEQGTEQWRRILTGGMTRFFRGLCVTTDGGFVLAGGEFTEDLNLRATALKFAPNGDSLWTYTADDIPHAYANCVTPAADGGCVIGGDATLDADHHIAFLYEVDAAGNRIWYHHYNMPGDEECMAVAPAIDGGYFMTGNLYNSEYNSVWVMKTTPTGDSLWSNSVRVPMYLEVTGIHGTEDGGLAITSINTLFRRLDWYYGSVFLARFNAEGDTLWTRNYMPQECITTGTMDVTRDGGFIIATSGGLLRLNAEGDSLWTIPNYVGTHCGTTSDGGYLLAGAMGYYNLDLFLLKTEPELLAVEPISVPVANDVVLHSNYPNPFNAATTIRFDVTHAGDLNLTVFDMNGRLVRLLAEGKYSAGSHTMRFDAGELPSGIYFCRLNTGGQTAIQKMVLLK